MNMFFCGESNIPIFSYPTHSHKIWEIIVNTSGYNRSAIGDNFFEIAPGDVMVIPPNTPHSAISQNGYTDMYIQAENLDFSGIFVISDRDKNIETLTKILRKTSVQKENNYQAIADGLLFTICEIIKQYKSNPSRQKNVFELKNILYSNIKNCNFSLTETMKSFDYNIDYIRRQFVRETGKTPHKYLTDLRMGQAKKLLIQENFISIEDVAANSGFSDPFYFSTAFKKEFGVSPTAYRKNVKKAL